MSGWIQRMIGLAGICGCALGMAMDILPPQERISGKNISGLFDQANPDWSRGVVEFVGPSGSVLALGIVVDAEHRLLVTKASETDIPDIRARPVRGKAEALKKIGADRLFDVALYRMEGSQPLENVTWASEVPVLGDWVASATGEAIRGVRIGVMSAARRGLERSGGVLGVVLGSDLPNKGGIRVREVVQGGGAASAGMEAGDVILAIGGEKVVTAEELRKRVFAHEPGEEVEVTIRRDGKEMTRSVTLGHRALIFQMFSRNQSISGPTSKIKDGFPDILQHATLVSDKAMGGPVFNLKGEVVGINIARVNRSENYAIPADALRRVAHELQEDREGE